MHSQGCSGLSRSGLLVPGEPLAEMAEGPGIAPEIRRHRTLGFRPSSSSVRSPSIKLAPRAGLAPATARLTAGRSTIELPGILKVEPPDGLAPSSLRYECGTSLSMLRGRGNGVPGRACTCNLHLRRVALYLFELREHEKSAGPNTPHRVGSLTSSGAL